MDLAPRKAARQRPMLQRADVVDTVLRADILGHSRTRTCQVIIDSSTNSNIISEIREVGESYSPDRLHRFTVVGDSNSPQWQAALASAPRATRAHTVIVVNYEIR